ncbi:hypothetical protein P9112_012099 [Eukaryota sp. TZLM1-RC]
MVDNVATLLQMKRTFRLGFIFPFMFLLNIFAIPITQSDSHCLSLKRKSVIALSLYLVLLIAWVIVHQAFRLRGATWAMYLTV